ncbi:hypothetical protein NKDENANG_03912 [Candidatus Entotheonellaceae bacterium PAL068K]
MSDTVVPTPTARSVCYHVDLYFAQAFSAGHGIPPPLNILAN